MPPLCTIDIAPGTGDAVVARLTGELDLSNVRDVEHQLTTALQPGHVLVLDLARLSYVDSSGLGMIERLTHQSALRLVIPAEAVIARTLSITGLDQIVAVYATQAAALAHK
jgi:anti-anti-sigma factor